MRIMLFATLGLLAACQTVPPESSLTAQPLAPNVLAAAERSRAPGMVAGIIRDGRVVQAFSWGGMACDGSGAADVNAAYEIGSISKHITAVALLQLWERNRVDLNASVARISMTFPKVGDASRSASC